MQVEERGTELPNVFASFAATLGALQGGELDVIEAAEAWATSASECGQELEAQVWSLVSTFYASRLRTLEPLPTATDLKYLTPSSLVSAHLNSSQALADLAVLKDWLCATSPQPLPADIRRGYAPYSKHNNNSVSRQGKKPHSLDPDASLRHQSAFAPEDSAYDESLLRSLYELVRIGDLYQAVDLCRQADADWRAASLNGAAVWSHSKLEKTGGEQSKQTYQGAEGNLNRKLWKTTARKVAKTPSPAVKAYERALYGALAGDLQSVLPVCESWEDHLWAHLNAIFEDRIDQIVAHSSVPPTYFARTSFKTSLEPTAKDLAMAFDALLQRPGRVGTEARHPLRMTIACVAQDELSRLFQDFVSTMEQSGGDLDPENQANYVRFFSHLVLFFRGLGQSQSIQQPNLPLEACTKVIDAYVQILQLNDEPELVALYASQLQADNAVEAYAQFLASISAESSRSERQQALSRTREHDLDFASVAIRTTQIIIETSLSPPELNRDLLFSPELPESAAIESLVRSLEWLSFDRATYVEALLQSNALIRWFMISGLTAAAQRLIESLPKDLESAIAGILETDQMLELAVPPSRLNSALSELQHFKSFFGCLEAYDACRRWVPPPPSTKLEQRPVVEQLQVLTQKFYDVALSIFTDEWLELEDEVDVNDAQSEGTRLVELATLRKIYIPELVLRLHNILVESRSYIPSNLQKAIELSNVVADEVSHVYREFASEDGNRMGEYLSCLRDACVEALAESSNPFIVGGQ